MRDWPLALCDATTVAPEKDLEPADLVYADYVIENCQIYHTNRQKWYYLSDQTESEAWVFRQTDSKRGAGPGEHGLLPNQEYLENMLTEITGVPHSSFPNPEVSGDDPPRESIEVRAIVYYDGGITDSMVNHDKFYTTQAAIWNQMS